MAFGVTLLKESVSGTQLLGGAMVLAAVVLLAQRPTAKPVSMPAVQASA